VPRVSLFCVYPDGPYNLNQDRIACLPFFELVAISSPSWVDAFKRLGARRVEYLPFAVDTSLRAPAIGTQPKAELSHDVTFIGNWRPEREEFLEQLAEFDLRVWGGDAWSKRTRPNSPLRVRWGGRSLFGPEFAEVCAQSHIMLNVMDSATWPGPNMRVFEQAACRAFSLTTRSPAVTELFQEGETIECFDSVEEAREKIRFYLDHKARRQSIADASYNLVTQGGHTYVDRALQLESWAAAQRANAPTESFTFTARREI
jgi:spore maturation protein CgeB